MARNGDGQLVVTWYHAITVILPLLVVPILTNWAILKHHEERPHNHAVHVREFQRMSKDLDQIKEELRDIRRSMRRSK